MVAYGDTTAVETMLEPSRPGGFSAGLSDRIDAMREVVSRLLDEELGRSFGVAGVAELRGMPFYGGHSRMVLSTPARSIVSITTGMVDHGGVLSGGTLLTTDQWSVAIRDRELNICAIDFGGGDWSGYWPVAQPVYSYPSIVGVNALWADADLDTAIPPEIDWLVNYVTAKSIQEEQASPAGFVGQDGTVTPMRNPWTDPKVKKTIAKFRLVTKELIV